MAPARGLQRQTAGHLLLNITGRGSGLAVEAKSIRDKCESDTGAGPTMA